MPSIVPDFSEAAGIKPGDYLAQISDSELKTSQAGNGYVKWKLTTAGNPDAGANGALLFYNTNYTGKGAFRFKKFVEAAVGETIADEIANFNTDDLHGRTVMVTVVDNPESSWPEVKAVRAAGV